MKIKILSRILIALLLLPLLLYAALWIPAVQQKVKDIALTQVMKITGSQISVGTLQLRPFTQLRLTDVYAADLHGDTLLYAHTLSVSFSIRQLLQRRLVVSYVALDQFSLHLKKDSANANFNFQFLADAFASGDTTATSTDRPFSVELDEILMTNGRVWYDVLSEPHIAVGFDPNHVAVHELNMELNIHSIPPDALSADLRTLSFTERSGFQLKDLTTSFYFSEGKVSIDKLQLHLPQSSINIPAAWFCFNPPVQSNEQQYSLELNGSLQPTDLSAFYLPLGVMTEKIELKLKASGTLPNIDVLSLELRYGQHIGVSATASIADYINWENSQLRLNISDLYADAQGIEQLLALRGDGPQRISQLSKADRFRLNAELSGSLANMNVRLAMSNPAWQLRQSLAARSSAGSMQRMAPQLSLQGRTGHSFSTGQSHFDLRLAVRNFNLRSVVSNPDLGALSMGLRVWGRRSGGQLQAQVNSSVDQLFYHGYNYHGITVDGRYNQNNMQLSLASKDTNMLMDMSAKLDLRNKRKPTADLGLQAHHLRLSKLGWLPDSLAADLSMALKVNAEGTSVEQMKASLCIDQLNIKSTKGNFQEPFIKLNFLSAANGSKDIALQSSMLNSKVEGEFCFATLATSVQNTMSAYFPKLIPPIKVKKKSNDWFEWTLDVNNTESLSKSMELPLCLLQPAHLKVQYGMPQHELAVHGSIPMIKVSELLLLNNQLELYADTLHRGLQVHLQGHYVNNANNDTLQVVLAAESLCDSVELALTFSNQLSTAKLDAQLKAGVRIGQLDTLGIPPLLIHIRPSYVSVNQQQFNIRASSMEITNDYYRINDFELARSAEEYLEIDGTISKHEGDSLNVRLSKIRLSSLLTVAQSDLPLTGIIDGKITAYELLTAPHFTTNSLNIDSIAFDSMPIGNLNIRSTWDERQAGLLVDARLHKVNGQQSSLYGMVFPTQDSLDLKLDLVGIELNWLSSMMASSLYALAGQMNLKAAAQGKISSPQVSGFLGFDQVNIGIAATNTQYRINDTIYLYSDKIDFKEFNIVDERDQTARIMGIISHKDLSSFKSDVQIRMDDFMVLNNAHQTDSLYYGSLRVRGTVGITGTESDMLVKAALGNQGRGRVFVKLPESVNQAQRFNSITFINPNAVEYTADTSLQKINFPLKLELTFEVTPELTLGTVLNPVNKDEATISGSGTIDLNYNLPTAQMSIMGTYTVREGRANITLANITKRTFQVRRGGTINFKGDPMATTFSITVEYGLRASLSNLDPNFETFLPSTRTRVVCVVTVSGNAKKIDIGYDIEFPDLDENMKRKTDALLATEEIKIREIAYLMALGTFSGSNNASGNLWTSLASSTLTTQLNSLLAGVLRDNWTVGTELHNNNNNGVDMDVNISTHLFDERLTVTSSIGYKSTPTSGNNKNVTGDFDARYKLTKSGNVVLRMYQVANQDYFEQALTTQGVGVLYRQQEKKFWNLFRRRKKSK